MKAVTLISCAVAVLGCRRVAADREAKQTGSDKPTFVDVRPDGSPCGAGAVRVESGCVRGSEVDHVVAYRGIPYAAPPTGARRWKPPAPAAPWHAVRVASDFGKACPQQDTLGGTLATDEDCLTLNVWTPRDAKRAPVMVWIHGGGLVQGGSALPFYDGARLAAAGVVLVSFNYRLGALGYLAHPALTAEDTAHHASGNYGLLDQIAALQWVKANAAAFGGDPSNVTIFGESAGGESVCALMASPLANGLFARAAIESASCVDYGKALRALADAHGTFESRYAQGERIAKVLGCGNAACLRAKTPDDLLRAAPPAVGFLGKGESFGLAVDGYALPKPPATAQLANVPLLVGSNQDEATLFTGKRQIRLGGYLAVIAKLFGNDRRVYAEYAPRRFGGVQQAFDALVTDFVFTCPSRRVARELHAKQSHVYRYLFSHVTAANASSGKGATHGAEIPFVFGTQTSPTSDERALATTMIGYWTHFARTGDPNLAGAPRWPAYDASDRYLELDTPIRAAAGLHTSGCDLFDSLPGQVDADAN